MWHSPSFKKCVAALMALTSSLAIASEDCADNDPRPECKDPPITVTDVPPTGTTGYGTGDNGNHLSPEAISIYLSPDEMGQSIYENGTFFYADFYTWKGPSANVPDAINYLNSQYGEGCQYWLLSESELKIRCWYP